MTDRELLDMAAKAMGWWDNDFNCPSRDAMFMGDPLEDNDAAMRLMMALRMCVNVSDAGKKTSVSTGRSLGRFDEYHNGNVGVATRRAIVRAAAAIGAMSNV